MPEIFAFTVAQTAQKSLLYEASAYPKPGLVTPLDSGSHHDMSYHTFIDSAIALLPCFINCTLIGYETKELAPSDVLGHLREAGKQGEKEMYRKTDGVNTHKGAIFSMGLLCAATGRLRAMRELLLPSGVALMASLFVKGIVSRELRSLQDVSATAGERAYVLYGMEGARGEAEKGFPLTMSALKELEKLEATGLSFREKLAHALLGVMARNEDTNLVRRGGLDAMVFVQEQSKKALVNGGMLLPEGRLKIAEMESVFVARNLSPGGSADILSNAVFLWMLQERFM